MRTLAPVLGVGLLGGCCPDRPGSVKPASALSRAASEREGTKLGVQRKLDVASEVELVATTWREVADRQCCLDETLVRWYPTGPEFPQLMLDLTGEGMALRMFDGEDVLPSALPRAFFFDVLAAAERAGAPIVLPNGNHRIAAVESGFLVGIGKGEWGGGLYFLPSHPADQTGAREARGLGDNLLKDDDSAVVGVVPIGPREAMVLQDGYPSAVVCVSQEPSGVWKETARASFEGYGVLGPDDTSKGAPGGETAIIAKRSGGVLVAGCKSGVDPLARISLIDIDERRRSGEDPGCFSPYLAPTSVRRFADGTIAVTTRHTLTLLEPDGPEFTPRWYTRASRCE